MIQNALEGNRRFGVMGFSPYLPGFRMGTEVEIIECANLPQGRFKVEVVGRRMFHAGPSTVDEYGLQSATVEWVDHTELHIGHSSDLNEVVDETGSENAVSLAATLEMSNRVGELVEEWKRCVVELGWERHRQQISTLLHELGPIPPTERFSARAVWVAALVNPLPPLGVSSEIRPAVLQSFAPDDDVHIHSLQSSHLRLKAVEGALQVRIPHHQALFQNFNLITPSFVIRIIFNSVLLVIAIHHSRLSTCRTPFGTCSPRKEV
jgi:hypothetical protein